jgi:thymidylate synthase (FAD)
MNEEIPVLDKGFVRLDACLADDLSVVNSARVSFHTRHAEMEEGDDKLIGFLMKRRHGSPFEHTFFRFHVKAPIFVFREWHRHRIASINEWSARYSELKPDFYIPAPEDVRTQIGKPGAYTYERADENKAETFRECLETNSRESYEEYRYALEKGIAKEQARLFLPVNIYSEMYWSVNARALMNFLSLRNAPTAQYEIRRYAEVLETLFAQAMPFTAAAFIDNGRQAP